MKNNLRIYLKRLSWVLLFLVLAWLSEIAWGSIMDRAADVMNYIWLQQLLIYKNIFIYVTIPVLAAVINYFNARLNGFSLVALFLYPSINYYYLLLAVVYALGPSGEYIFANGFIQGISPVLLSFFNQLLFALAGGLLGRYQGNQKEDKEIFARN